MALCHGTEGSVRERSALLMYSSKPHIIARRVGTDGGVPRDENCCAGFTPRKHRDRDGDAVSCFRVLKGGSRLNLPEISEEYLESNRVRRDTHWIQQVLLARWQRSLLRERHDGPCRPSRRTVLFRRPPPSPTSPATSPQCSTSSTSSTSNTSNTNTDSDSPSSTTSPIYGTRRTTLCLLPSPA